MSKDDYHVLAYQLLSYLYDCLRRGDNPETRCVTWSSGDEREKVNERYWNYILVHLRIEYLKDNRMMKKARLFIKGLADEIDAA